MSRARNTPTGLRLRYVLKDELFFTNESWPVSKEKWKEGQLVHEAGIRSGTRETGQEKLPGAPIPLYPGSRDLAGLVISSVSPQRWGWSRGIHLSLE